MALWLVLRVFVIILVLEFPYRSLSGSEQNFELSNSFQRTKNLEKRSLITFPPDSLLQINMGITLSGQLEKNSGTIVLAFQQNAPLPNETQPHVVSGRKFSIYNHLRNIITSYGLNGSECLKKMVCQIGETPLLGGLVEDLITFALSPSKHRSIQNGDFEEKNYVNSLLESERLGKSGKNCSSAFFQCARTPLDFISSIIRV